MAIDFIKMMQQEQKNTKDDKQVKKEENVAEAKPVAQKQDKKIYSKTSNSSKLKQQLQKMDMSIHSASIQRDISLIFPAMDLRMEKHIQTSRSVKSCWTTAIMNLLVK